MLRVLCAAALVCALAGFGFAAGIPSQTIYGNYIEARTADVYTGPVLCQWRGRAGRQLAVMRLERDRGCLARRGPERAFGGGRGAGAAYAGRRVSKPSYPVKSVLIVDSRANAEQRLALTELRQTNGRATCCRMW